MKKIDAPRKAIFICDGKKCGKYSKEIRQALKHEIKEGGLKKQVGLVIMECTGNCKLAPIICLQPDNIWIGEITEKDIGVVLKGFVLRMK